MAKIPEIEIGSLKVKMTVDEFIDFLKKTEPSEMAAKLQALSKTQTSLQPSPTQ